MRRGITAAVVLASLLSLLWLAQLAWATKPFPGRSHTIDLEVEPQSIAVGDTVRFVIYFTPCEDVESLNVSLRPTAPIGVALLDYLPRSFFRFARKGEMVKISGFGVFDCPGLYTVPVYYSHLHPSGYPPPVRYFKSFLIRVPGGLVKPPSLEERLPLQLEEAPLRMGYPCGGMIHIQTPPPRTHESDDTAGIRFMTSDRLQRKVPTAEDSLLSVEYTACVGGFSYRISISENGDFRYVERKRGGNDAERSVAEQVRSSVVGQVPVHEMRELFEVVTEGCFMTWDIGEEATQEPVDSDCDYEYMAVTIRGRTNSFTTYEPFRGPIFKIREKLCDIKMKIEGSR